MLIHHIHTRLFTCTHSQTYVIHAQTRICCLGHAQTRTCCLGHLLPRTCNASHTHSHKQTHTHTYTRTHTHTHKHTLTHTHTHTHICIHTHIYTHIYTHTRARRPWRLLAFRQYFILPSPPSPAFPKSCMTSRCGHAPNLEARISCSKSAARVS